MIRSRYEACRILGLSPYATQEQIKSAYRELLKQYHPDALAGEQTDADRLPDGKTGDAALQHFYRIREAYEYLEANPMENAKIIGQVPKGQSGGNRKQPSAPGSSEAGPKPSAPRSSRVLGSPGTGPRAAEERAAYEKWSAGSKARKKAAFEKRVQNMHEELAEKERLDRQYREAMKAINNILIAEAIRKTMQREKGEEEHE